jgi:hypothetical protein
MGIASANHCQISCIMGPGERSRGARVAYIMHSYTRISRRFEDIVQQLRQITTGFPEKDECDIVRGYENHSTRVSITTSGASLLHTCSR